MKSLRVKPDHIITDSYEINEIAQHSQTNINRADNLSITVAAASIIAKVYRDTLMEMFHNDKAYNIYGFDKHKGYGTVMHREMIKKHGFSNLHRRSFKVR